MKSRAEAYASLVNESDVADDQATSARHEHVEAIHSILETGLGQIQEALAKGDFQRGEIEADHIHNLPRRLEAMTPGALDYYLNRERTYYLEQLEKFYGVDVKVSVEDRFHKHWEQLKGAP